MAQGTTRDLETFRGRVDAVVHSHPVVVDNAYTRWFAKGEATRDEVRHLTIQFSVFSHLFVEAQLRKVINAADLESYHAGKEILMSERGVIFNARKDDDQHAAHAADELREAFFQPGFDEEKFVAGAADMLEGVKAFWDGLEADRLAEGSAR